ncbi:MAG: hypothetical protein SFX72_06540 [Isosphaeraceae bacterium]|nr:hypothetical protein [Isosphaeraceae bacterium]
MLFDLLEARRLLAAPEPFRQVFQTVEGSSQFNNGVGRTESKVFYGATFDESVGVGGFVSTLFGDVGGRLDGRFQGKAGFEVGYYIDTGSVSATYDSTLVTNYAEPTSYESMVVFDPRNTYITYGDAISFQTTTPSAGASVDLVFMLKVTLRPEVRFFGANSSTTFELGSTDVSMNSIFDFDFAAGELSLLGIPCFSDDNSPTSWFDLLGAEPSIELAIPFNDYVSLVTTVGLESVNTLTQSIDLEYSASAAFKNWVKSPSAQQALDYAEDLGLLPTISRNLASAYQRVPTIELDSGDVSAAAQSSGVLTASSNKEDATFAELSLQMGNLLGAVNPLLGALATTTTFSSGPFEISVTPISYQLAPNLYLDQHATAKPVNHVTYAFQQEDAQGNWVNSTEWVSLNGSPIYQASSVTFLPGVDTLTVKFGTKPIKVQRSWDFGINFENTVDLKSDLEGRLTVGRLDYDFGIVEDTLVPIVQHSDTFFTYKLAHAFDGQFDLDLQGSNASNPMRRSFALDSFLIGDTFIPDTDVTNTSDGTSSGALRTAVITANNHVELDQHGQIIPVVLELEEGTYTLNIGELEITHPDLRIIGKGAAKTILQQTGARHFRVENGGGLTLEGVTLRYGSGRAHPSIISDDDDNGGSILVDGGGSLALRDSIVRDSNATLLGGAIRAMARSSLIVEDRVFYSNVGGSGGAVHTAGSLATFRNTTFQSNKARFGARQGGGLRSSAASLLIDSSTFQHNSAGQPGSGGTARGGALSISEAARRPTGTRPSRGTRPTCSRARVAPTATGKAAGSSSPPGRSPCSRARSPTTSAAAASVTRLTRSPWNALRVSGSRRAPRA